MTITPVTFEVPVPLLNFRRSLDARLLVALAAVVPPSSRSTCSSTYPSSTCPALLSGAVRLC